MKDIDNCVLDNGMLRDLEEGYYFPITQISTGAKALMILNSLEEAEIWGTIFGDNCTDLLLELAENKDIVIYLEHVLHFSEEKFQAVSQVQNHKYVSYKEYIIEAITETSRPFWKHLMEVNYESFDYF